MPTPLQPCDFHVMASHTQAGEKFLCALQALTSAAILLPTPLGIKPGLQQTRSPLQLLLHLPQLRIYYNSAIASVRLPGTPLRQLLTRRQLAHGWWRTLPTAAGAATAWALRCRLAVPTSQAAQQQPVPQRLYQCGWMVMSTHLYTVSNSHCPGPGNLAANCGRKSEMKFSPQ